VSLVFEYAALETEMNAFAHSARATASRPQGLDGLEGIQAAIVRLKDIASVNHKERVPWTQASWAPIQTTVSEGAFMRDGNGGLHVLAKLTFIWEIRNFGRFHRAGFRRFELAGNASCRIDIVKADAPSEVLAMWRFEVASHDGPGCHFHTQVLGDDEVTAGVVFPHSVDIPRLPGFLITPTDALEFVLGELFQDEWRQRAIDTSPEIMVWRSYQQSRLSRVLNWQSKTIVDAIGSPWIALKSERPKPDLIFDVGPER
jgi:hypothetical protein